MPQEIALLTAAKVLPPVQQQRLQQDAKHPELIHILRSANFLPATALTLISFGQQAGTLDLALEQLARLYRDMFRYTRGHIRIRHEQQDYDAVADFTPGEFGEEVTLRITEQKHHNIMHRSGASEVTIPLGKILLDAGKISREQLKQALTLQKSTGEKLGRILINLGFVSEQDVMEAYTSQSRGDASQ